MRSKQVLSFELISLVWFKHEKLYLVVLTFKSFVREKTSFKKQSNNNNNTREIDSRRSSGNSL